MASKGLLFMLALGTGATALVLVEKKAAAKKKRVDEALDLGLDKVDTCESEETLGKFAEAQGYKIFYFDEKAAAERAKLLGKDNWLKVPPKEVYVKTPNAKSYSKELCSFIQWNSNQWVTDDATNQQLEVWLAGPSNEQNPTLPPPPIASTRAYTSNPIDMSLFSEWWAQSGNPDQGIMGFWVDTKDPLPGTDWVINIVYDNVVIVTNDGAFWWSNEGGWMPASTLAFEYDTWYNANK